MRVRGLELGEGSSNFPDDVKPFLARVALDSPEGRWGTVAEVADAALYLVSPRAGYVSGATLLVTGAFHIATAF
jgi:NAD(P)-dependent dehydrogenase (short-subunit alcohol dehydrogenase family)